MFSNNCCKAQRRDKSKRLQNDRKIINYRATWDNYLPHRVRKQKNQSPKTMGAPMIATFNQYRDVAY